jgi:hypothetical protein
MQNAKSGFLSSVGAATALAVAVLLAGCGGDGSADSASSPAAAQSSGSTVASDPAAGSALPGPTTSSATLNWAAPTTNTNGSALTNLGGYKIYYGTSSNQLTSTVTINNPGQLIYVIDGLRIGTTYYFTIAAVTTGGVESVDSAIVSAQIS